MKKSERNLNRIERISLIKKEYTKLMDKIHNALFIYTVNITNSQKVAPKLVS